MSILVKNVLPGLCALIVIVAIYVTVIPPENREMRETLKTLSIINAVKDDVNAYYEAVSNIPVDLRNERFLNSEAVSKSSQWEPYLDTRFTYERMGNITYRLCASFDAVPTDEMRDTKGYGQFMFDRAGNTCFDIGAERGVSEPVYRAIYP